MAAYKNDIQYYQRFNNPQSSSEQIEPGQPRPALYNPSNNGLRVQMQLAEPRMTPLMMKYNRGSSQ